MPVTTIPFSSRPSLSPSTSTATSPHRHRGHFWGESQQRYERAFDHPGQHLRHWRQGDIAFLKPEDAFSPQDHDVLIKPAKGAKFGYLPAKATGHPVIILSSPTERSTHVLITPVSAYSSGEDNNYLPPWEQEAHKWKYHRCFRSFDGCERYSDEFPPLYLEGGKSMPKPRASWLYVQSLWVVPLSVIGIFTKTRDLLRVRQDSVKSLLDHMKAECKSWKERVAEMETHERRANGMADKTPAAVTSWRSNQTPVVTNQACGYTQPQPPSSSSPPSRSWASAAGYKQPRLPPPSSSSPPSSPPSCSWASAAKFNSSNYKASVSNSNRNGNGNGSVPVRNGRYNTAALSMDWRKAVTSSIAV